MWHRIRGRISAEGEVRLVNEGEGELELDRIVGRETLAVCPGFNTAA